MYPPGVDRVIRKLGIGLLALSWATYGQNPAPPVAGATQPQPPPPTQVPPMTLMKKSVVFIQGTYPRRSPADHCVDPNGNASDTCTITGTGFLLFYPDDRVGKDGGFSYLVTNKHMVREPGLDGTLGKGKFLPTISARINTRKPLQEGGVSFTFGPVPVTYQSGDLFAFVEATDPHVDLAIMPISLNPESLDYFMIQPMLFATEEVINDKHLDESDSVIFAGLFAPYIGNLRNYPIVRHGKLAMVSQEKIPWEPGVTEDLFLADVMSFGGNSGSPVFIRTDGDNQPLGSYSYYLLGVMQGYYQADSKVTVQTAEQGLIAKENTGVAAVVPAQKISDILGSPRAVSQRDVQVAKILLGQGKLKEAVELYKTAVDRLAQFDEYHPDLALAKIAYADALEKSGDKAGSAQQIKEARAIQRPNPVLDDDRK
jgi:hypothetical protein